MSKSKCQNFRALGVRNWEFRFQQKAGYVALATMLLTMVVSLALIGGFTFFAYQEVRSNRAFTGAVESRYVAEGGIEDMVYRVVSGKQYSASETLGVGKGTTTIIVSTSGDKKTIRSEGKRNSFQQNLETKVEVTTTSISFHYGVQVGDGGLTMDSNSRVNGNIYSNGNVTGSGTITGDAFVAGGIAATSSYSWETNNADQAFATTSASRDIAQSFIATSTGALNKVSVYIKKAGSPANDITLRITADNGGKPQNSSLASAVIKNSSVGASASWIDVSFASPANMTNGSKYWIVLDYGASSGTNYWVWRKDTSDAYASNTGKYTSDWNSGGAVWTDTSADLDFKIWIGGVNTKIDGITIGAPGGTSKGHANLFVNVTANGASCPNADCIVENPPREEFAISDGIIQDWKDDAACGGCTVINGNYTISGSTSLGPAKINGNLDLGQNAILTVTGTIWVTGSIDISKDSTVKLASGYGSLSAVIISDDIINVKKDSTFQGSGMPGSYVMLLSAKDAPASTVLDVDKDSTSVIYFANKGRIRLHKNSVAKEITGYGIDLDKDTTITYESGLANSQFSSGPSAGYSVEYWRGVP